MPHSQFLLWYKYVNRQGIPPSPEFPDFPDPLPYILPAGQRNFHRLSRQTDTLKPQTLSPQEVQRLLHPALYSVLPHSRQPALPGGLVQFTVTLSAASLKASGSTVFIPSGRVTVRFLHPAKQLPGSCVTPSGMRTSCKPVHPSNARTSMVLRESGSAIFSNPVQPLNALPPISVSVSGSVISASFMQPANVPPARLVKPWAVSRL